MDYEITADVPKLIPRELASKHQVMPLGKQGSTLSVAMGSGADTLTSAATGVWQTTSGLLAGAASSTRGTL